MRCVFPWLWFYQRCVPVQSSEAEISLRAMGARAFEVLWRTDRGKANYLTPEEKDGLAWLRGPLGGSVAVH